MILNHQHRFLFIHVPKAAGTTITRALSPLTTFRDIELGGTKYGEAVQERFAARFDLRKHSTGAMIRAKCPAHIWRGFFVFAFVRNPYARAYSVFRFLRRWRDGPYHQLASSLDFTAFLDCEEVAANEIEIARPQTHWLTADDERLSGLDFIGRVEEFESDFSFVLSTIHRRRITWREGRRDNVSASHDEWRDNLTPDAAAKIERLYASDFELWEYDRLRLANAA